MIKRATSATAEGHPPGATAIRSIDDVLTQLGTLDIGDDTKGLAACKGEHLRIVDYVPSGSLVNEEEVALGANITLKLSGKPSWKKSPAMWVVSNTRILKKTDATRRF